jgi:hypothetical protein
MSRTFEGEPGKPELWIPLESLDCVGESGREEPCTLSVTVHGVGRKHGGPVLLDQNKVARPVVRGRLRSPPAHRRMHVL